jgi:hypothetical protein
MKDLKLLQFPLPKMNRRRPENALRRATQEAEQIEERQIDYWLALADTALDSSWDRLRLRKKSI